MLEPGQFAHTGDDDGDSDDEMMDEKEGFLLLIFLPQKKKHKNTACKFKDIHSTLTADKHNLDGQSLGKRRRWS
jgi:hypothetical protein